MGFKLRSKKYYLIIPVLGFLFILFYVKRCRKNSAAPLPIVLNQPKKDSSFFAKCSFVTIPSDFGKEPQKAFLYRSTLPGKQPLIISLHTWGGTYKQDDSLLTIIEQNNWNYIHPDYGGQQWLKNSCCFDPSIQYIDEAIAFGINNCAVDTSKIIVIGKSGGGSGVLAALLKSKYNNLHFMCWSPITDYILWHNEVQKNDDLKKRYYDKILLGTGSKKTLDTLNAKLKSPYYFNFDKVKNEQFKDLTMYVGIRDGLDGWSTSISQPINFYNKLLRESGCSDSSKYITAKDHKLLLEKRENYYSGLSDKLGTRPIIYNKSFRNFRIIFFSGGHEIILNAANDELKSLM